MRRPGIVAAVAALLVVTACGSEGSDEAGGGSGETDSEPSGDMILATTTSTQDSGLLDELIPTYEEGSECVVKTVAVGSGQAMTMGERGDADTLLVHSPEAEEEFMTDGYGSSREPVMYNDFVVVGPPDDAAGTSGSANASEALSQIADSSSSFASRADDSGTHAKEMGLWEEAGIEPSGEWYIETGQGMGDTLTIANQREAYTLADRGTFLATSNIESEITFEGSEDLVNPYHVIVVEGEGINTACAEEFSGWLQEDSVQETIGQFGEDEYGEPLFFPDAA